MNDQTESSQLPPRQPAAQAQIPLIYSNGFNVNASLSDFGVLFMYDGVPAMKLALSFTTAKTLAAQLQEGVSAFEKATGQRLLTMDDVQKGYDSHGLGNSNG